MIELASKVPKLNRLFKFQFEKAQDCYVLLFPEGMIKLNGSASAILLQVDGTKSVGDIVAALQAEYPDAEGIEEDVLAFFEHAEQKRWINYV
ncbi:MAG: pyrroloquinoline quinone biosynthesis peptide chaperone PqqD [Alteromonas oceani]